MEDDKLEIYDEEESNDLELVEVEDQPEAADENKPQGATFGGNAVDLTSFIALITGAIIFLTCITCGMGLYALPFLAIVLGIIGVVSAKQATNPDRTQLWSWLGIGSGILVILLGLIGIAAYVILLLGIVRASGY